MATSSRAWAPGDYDYFRVDADGTVLRPAEFEYQPGRGFALRRDGDRAAIAGIVRAFGDSLSISVYGDRGETWFSWILRQPS